MIGAKFNKGDRVSWKLDGSARKYGRIAQYMGYDTWTVAFDDGREEAIETRELSIENSVRSTNSARPSKVVANALNAVARNFTPTSDFEVGDTVRFKDSVRSVPHDETYKVVKVSGRSITIKGGRDNSTSTEFADNLDIVENAVARNANGLDGLIADLDSGKYDSVNWMPKVIGPGTLYPDGMKFPTGLGYDDEEKVRAAWKSGKYASVVLYKGGSKRGEIPVNVRNAKIIDDNTFRQAYMKACIDAARDVDNKINSLRAAVESTKMNDVSSNFLRYYADIVSTRNSIAAFIGACR